MRSRPRERGRVASAAGLGAACFVKQGSERSSAPQGFLETALVVGSFHMVDRLDEEGPERVVRRPNLTQPMPARMARRGERAWPAPRARSAALRARASCAAA